MKNSYSYAQYRTFIQREIISLSSLQLGIIIMIDLLTYVTNLRPTIKDVYGMKRNLTGYNIYLHYFLSKL